MTRRQKALGCTEDAVERAKNGEFLCDMETFIAKMATVKKGEYIALELTKQFFGEFCSTVKHEYEIKPLLHGLTVLMPEHFYYTDTLGLDCLTIK